MQQLHLVGFTADLQGLILSPRKGSKTAAFVVPIDDRLKAAVEECRSRLDGRHGAEGAVQAVEAPDNGNQGRPRPESLLTVREMQARLRAGSTVADVARASGTDETWVEPFAVPILAERAEVVTRAQLMTLSKPRRGESAHPLGAAVISNLAGRGLGLPADLFDAAWTAWNLTNGTWMVRFSYTSRGKAQVAEWEVDLRSGAVVAHNRLGSELGFVDRGRRPQVRPLSELEEVRPSQAGAAKASSRRRAPAGTAERRAGSPAKKGAARTTGGTPTAKARGKATAPKVAAAKKVVRAGTKRVQARANTAPDPAPAPPPAHGDTD